MRAYGYCRYSSDLQNEASIEQQKSELLEYAKKNNINIIKFYCDEAKSGTKDTRENFQCMISDCKKQLVDCILVWKTDRFARNTQDALFYKMKLEKLGIQLISITQPIDTTTPEGSLMYTLLAGMDEYYSKNLASNVKRALKSNAHNCLSNGGTAPLGYDIIDRKYVVNEQEAIIIKKIFDMYINGVGITEIASKLNLNGYTTKKGKPFGKNSIFEIIGNEKYTGTYLYNKSGGYNRHEKRDDTIRIENAFEPIISHEIFNKAMERRQINRKCFRTHKANHIYLLSGLIYCGDCGAKYCGSTSTKNKAGVTYKTGYYTCANRNKIGKCKNHIIRQDDIEEYVFKALIEKILNGNSVDSLIQKIQIEYNKMSDDSEEIIKDAQKQLQTVNAKLNNLVSMLECSPSPSIVKRIDELDSQKLFLEEKIEVYKKLTKDFIPESKIIEVLKKDVSSLKNESKEEAKKIIQKYVKRITIYSDRFEIDFTFTKEVLMVAGVSGLGSPRPDTMANIRIVENIFSITTKKRG